MSSLKVDNITGRGSAGFTGSVKTEGGNTTTDLQQGLCKVWVSYEQDDDSSPGNTTHGSFNLSTQTDVAAGRTRTNFNNNFSDAGYSFTSTVFDGSGRNDLRNIGHDRNNDTYTSSALEYYCWNYAATTLDDAFRYFGQFMGDLA